MMVARSAPAPKALCKLRTESIDVSVVSAMLSLWSALSRFLRLSSADWFVPYSCLSLMIARSLNCSIAYIARGSLYLRLFDHLQRWSFHAEPTLQAIGIVWPRNAKSQAEPGFSSSCLTRCLHAAEITQRLALLRRRLDDRQVQRKPSVRCRRRGNPFSGCAGSRRYE